jgi:hypothetical protein
MPYTKQIQNWIRSFSLDAALIATLALPAVVLVLTELAHSQPATRTHVITQGHGKQERAC